jgi:hypothetical protein
MTPDLLNIDKLARRTQPLLDGFQAMSQLRQASDKLCASDHQKQLPADFVGMVKSFRIRIDDHIRELNKLSQAIKESSGTDQASLEKLNQWYRTLCIEGQHVTNEFEAITRREKDVIPNGVWVVQQ